MSEHRYRLDERRAPAAHPRSARRPAGGPSGAAAVSETPGSRSRSASSSSAARPTRPASGSPSWWLMHQRRALRIAYQYLRDAADADEAVQDAFVKVFSHIGSYREAWPFEVWFTRILINGCLDRRKARARRERWFAPADDQRSTRRGRRFGGTGRSIPKRACWPASGAHAWRRPSTGSMAGSGRSSCCATTATARRARSAR